MPELTDTQSLILSRASQRDDRIALPLPGRLRGAAAKKVVTPLIERGFLIELDADPRKRGGKPPRQLRYRPFRSRARVPRLRPARSR